MKDLILFISEGKFIKRNFINKEDYFEQVSYELLSEGYVTKEFYEGILNREKEFPTGIQTMSIGVSIPHCESEYVLKSAIVVVVFESPIKFHRMDQPNEILETQISFILLIKDKSKHLTTLQQLVTLFQSQALSKLIDKNSLQEVLDLIKGEDLND